MLNIYAKNRNYFTLGVSFAILRLKRLRTLPPGTGVAKFAASNATSEKRALQGQL
jgi:hypothetical protein